MGPLCLTFNGMHLSAIHISKSCHWTYNIREPISINQCGVEISFLFLILALTRSQNLNKMVKQIFIWQFVKNDFFFLEKTLLLCLHDFQRVRKITLLSLKFSKSTPSALCELEQVCPINCIPYERTIGNNKTTYSLQIKVKRSFATIEHVQ